MILYIAYYIEFETFPDVFETLFKSSNAANDTTVAQVW